MPSGKNDGEDSARTSALARIGRQLVEPVPLTGSNPMAVPVMVPRWLYLILAVAAVGLFLYFLFSLFRRFIG